MCHDVGVFRGLCGRGCDFGSTIGTAGASLRRNANRPILCNARMAKNGVTNHNIKTKT